MTLKEFLANFDFNHPDFSAAPADFPNCSLSGLNSEEVGKFLGAKTEWEISRPPQPDQRSRQSQTPNGYIHLIAWSNACLLRILMTVWFRRYRRIHGYNKGFYRNLKDFKGANDNSDSSSKLLQNPVNSSNFAAPFPLTSPKSPLNSSNSKGLYRNLEDSTGQSTKFLQNPVNSFNSPSPLNPPKLPLNSFTPAWLNPKLLDRLEAQLLDALRSTIANIEEGYGRPTTIEYLNFLGYTQASLKEAKGDVQRMKQDELLASKPGLELSDLGIDLAAWHTALKKSAISRPAEDKGIYRNLQDFRGPEQKNPGGAGPLPLNPLKSPVNSFIPVVPNPPPPLTSPKSPLNSFIPVVPNPPPPLTSPKSPLNSYNFGYPPVDNFDPSQLSYEMLIELINKTDWNLRQLVASLETKLDADQKGFQIDRARIRGKVNWRK